MDGSSTLGKRSVTGVSSDGGNWNCSSCTFSNHEALLECEVCEAPRSPAQAGLLPKIKLSPERKSKQLVQKKLVVSTMGVNSSSKSSDDIVSNTLMNRSEYLKEQSHTTSKEQPLLDVISKIMDQEKRVFVMCFPYPHHISQKHHFGASWSCGYRNIQMLCSSLFQIPLYRAALFHGDGEIPTIEGLQYWIEKAWEAGFDTDGAAHFDHRLLGKSDWIGTTECAALLRFFGIRAMIVDFVCREKNSKHFHSKADDVLSYVSRDEDEDNHDEHRLYGDFDNISSRVKDNDSEDEYLPPEVKRKRKQTKTFLSKSTNQAKAKGRTECGDTIHDIGMRLAQWTQNYFASESLSSPANRPSSSNGCESEAVSHISDGADMALDKIRFPLYFQYMGHSRSIVGIELDSQSSLASPATVSHLLIFDPVSDTQSLERNVMNRNKIWCRQVKKTPAQMKRYYSHQILYIAPGLMSDSLEIQRSKQLIGVPDHITSLPLRF